MWEFPAVNSKYLFGILLRIIEAVSQGSRMIAILGPIPRGFNLFIPF
jgi:hypothetical protein